MRHYGIIGYPLLHSFSAKYFNEKFAAEHIDAEYGLYPITIEDLRLKVESLLARFFVLYRVWRRWGGVGR